MKRMPSAKKHPQVVARLQSSLSNWPQVDQECLSLQDVAERTRCSKRRIRQLIELGLVDKAGNVGAKFSYTGLHVRQAHAVEKLVREGRYTLKELAWLNNPNSSLALNFAEELAPQEFLSILCKSQATTALVESATSIRITHSSFERRMLSSIATTLKAVVQAERTLIREAQEALRAARKLEV